MLLSSDGNAVTAAAFLMAPADRHEDPAWTTCGTLPDCLLACHAQLKEYFEGRRKDFDLPLAPSGTPFRHKVWDILRGIPHGRTISYAALATRLGDAAAVRAVGKANGMNPIAIIIPCHRVIGKDGGLVGYAGGLERKRWLLEHEGAISREATQARLF